MLTYKLADEDTRVIVTTDDADGELADVEEALAHIDVEWEARWQDSTLEDFDTGVSFPVRADQDVSDLTDILDEYVSAPPVRAAALPADSYGQDGLRRFDLR